MKIIRTKKEIQNRILEISDNKDNFVFEDYDYEDNMHDSYNAYNSKETLLRFVKWLTTK